MDYPLFVVSESNFLGIMGKGVISIVFANEGTAVTTELSESHGHDKVTSWEFNTEHTAEGSYGIDFEPLLLDAYTQSLLSNVLNTVSPATKDRILERIAVDRAYFAIFLDQAWSCCK